MLFKNETFVRVVLGIGFCFGFAASAADGGGSTVVNAGNQYQVCKDRQDLVRDAAKAAGTPVDATKLLADYDSCVQSERQYQKEKADDDKGNKCDKASEKFNDAQKDFAGNCPAVGYSDPKKCAQAIANCAKKDADS